MHVCVCLLYLALFLTEMADVEGWNLPEPTKNLAKKRASAGFAKRAMVAVVANRRALAGEALLPPMRGARSKNVIKISSSML